MKKLVLISVALFFSTPLFANQNYVCKHGDQERKISVVYQSEGQQVPCEVTYEKDGGSESLWRAENTAGYCEEKAEMFVERQRGWGWECSKM